MKLTSGLLSDTQLPLRVIEPLDPKKFVLPPLDASSFSAVVPPLSAGLLK
jgi:hypothetical protein